MKNINIILSVTKACCNGCKICCTNSTPHSPSMDFELLNKIVNKLYEYSKLNSNINKIIITGGEILCYKSYDYYLYDIIKLLQRLDCKIFFRTTGLHHEDRFDKMFFKIKEYKLIERTELGTSFNLYLPNIKKNFIVTISKVFKFLDYANVQIAVSPNNIEKTISQFLSSLQLLAFINIPSKEKLISDFYKTKILSFIVINKWNKILSVNVFPVIRTGRAQKSIKDFFKVENRKCDRNDLCQLVIDHNGIVYACDSVFAKKCPSIELGNIINDSINELIESRINHFNLLLKRLKATENCQINNVCSICNDI